MKIVGPYTLYLDANFKALTDIITLYNAKREATGTDVSVHVDNSHPAITIPLIAGWSAAGGSVSGYPVFIKMSTSTYTGDVMTGMPNRTYLDGNNVEQTRTWDEWKDSTHEHFDADDGDKLVPGNSFGTELTGAEIAALYADSDYTVLTATEFAAALPDPE